jgi:hypothetical protein
MRHNRRRIQERVELTRLAIGGWGAQTLFAATELGVFDLLKDGRELSARDVARELGTEEDATARLLGACAALDLLERRDGRFVNAPAADEHLAPGRPESMATWVALIGQWNQTFGKLAESVRTGEPAEVPEDHLGRSPEYTRKFIIGMHDYAIGPGRELARHLDLDGRKKLLDVGGGPGTYSILLAEANPDLSCTVLELPEVSEIARDVVAEHGLEDRVSTYDADYHTDTFPGGYDAVLVSNVLHQEDLESCLTILRNAHAALEPGGLLTIHAMFLNESGDGPVWPALHNLLMLLVYRGGRAYTVGQTFEMIEEAGFTEPKLHRMSISNAGAFVTATRP